MNSLDDDAFEALEDEVERLAALPEAGAEEQRASRRPGHRFDPVHDADDFEQLVRDALDGLPDDVLAQLEGVAIVVSDAGARQHAYGYYRGITTKYHPAAWEGFSLPDQIVIFRDTLVRDFGHDPELLRTEVTTTVRHEVAHHLGFDEDGVRRLGV